MNSKRDGPLSAQWSRQSQNGVAIVTASSGLIGQAAVKRLAKTYTVVGFARFLPPHPPEAECVCIDLTSGSRITAAFDRVRTAYGDSIASIVPLAAYFDFAGKPNPKYEEVTVRGTDRLLRHAKKLRLDQLIFASTMVVHAPGEKGEPINEDSPVAARLPYRESKLAAEGLIHDEKATIPSVIVRPAGVYDDQFHNAFLAHQIARIYGRSPTSRVYPGDLDAGQPYLHLDDLTEALTMAGRKLSLKR